MRYLLTRRREDNLLLAQKLKALAIRAKIIPLIRISPLKISADERRQLRAIRDSHYQWIIFTSSNSAQMLAKQFRSLKLARIFPPSCQVACVGRKTAQQVKKLFRIDRIILPSRGENAEQLWALLKRQRQIRESRILFPRAKAVTFNLASHLRNTLKCQVDEVILYETTTRVLSAKEKQWVKNNLKTGINIFLFSPSAFKAAYLNLGARILRQAKLISIGKTTSLSIKQKGLPTYHQFSNHTPQIIIKFIRRERKLTEHKNCRPQLGSDKKSTP